MLSHEILWVQSRTYTRAIQSNTLITIESNDRVLETTINKIKGHFPIPGIKCRDIPSWDGMGI